MSAYSKIIENNSAQDDNLAVHLNTNPLHLNWENLEEFDEEEDENFLTEAPHLDDQPGTSGLNASDLGNDSNDTQYLDDSGELEEDDEEIIDLSLDMNPTTINLFKLNIAYQEVLTQYMAMIDQLLHHNAFKKLELDMDIETEEVKRSVSRSGGRLGMVVPPYFGDFYNPGQPNNPDKTKLIKELNGLFMRDTHTYRWMPAQEKALQNAISEFALKSKIQPLVSKLEYVLDKQNDEEEDEIMKNKVTTIKSQIKKTQESYPPMSRDLIGDREANHDWEAISNLKLNEKRSAIECKLYWKNHLHPDINLRAWTASEDLKLKEIVKEQKEKNWPKIAKMLNTGRTPIQCIRRYRRKFCNYKRPFLPHEDAQVLSLVQKYGVGSVIPFNIISSHMKNRTPTQVHHRWNKTLDPSIKRGKWTAEEDICLLQAVAAYGTKWADIRDKNVVPGRNDCQLRERFFNALYHDANYKSWEKDEDIKLLKFVEAYGKKWAAIARKMGNRSDAQCLKRHKTLQQAKALGKPIKYSKREFLLCDGIQRCRAKLIKAICKDFNLKEYINGKPAKLLDSEEMSNLKITINSATLNTNPRKRKHWEILSPKILTEIEKEKDLGETIQLYDYMLSFKENQPRHMRKLTPVERAAEEEIIKCMTLKFQPLLHETTKEKTNSATLKTHVARKCRNLTPKHIFVHYLKKLNVDAQLVLSSIKHNNTHGYVTMKDVIEGKNNIKIVKEMANKPSDLAVSISKSTFERKLYLDLCAPSRATVQGFNSLLKHRDCRKRNAKTIILHEESEKENEKGKYTIEELLTPIQSSQEYKVFRSRFVSLFTWPAVLSSVIPLNRRGPSGTLAPIMKMKKAYLDQLYVKNPEDLYSQK